MALTLRFENYDASTTYDLTTPGTNLGLDSSTWITTPLGGDLVSDRMRLVATGTATQMRTAVQSLESLLENAREFHQQFSRADSVWLRFATDGETAKRSLIYDYELQPDSQAGRVLGVNATSWILVITRGRWWEETSETAVSFSTTPDWDGNDAFTYTTAEGGLPGRIAHFRSYAAISNTGAISSFWLGIKPNDYSLTNFSGLYNMDTGTMGTDTTRTARASFARNGYVARCSFATNTSLVARTTTRLADNSITDYDAYVGEYIVLVHWAADSGLNVNLQLLTGFDYSGQVPVYQGEIQYNLAGLGTSAYQFTEMGRVPFPPHGYRQKFQDAAYDLSNFFFQIKAGVMSGSGNLDISSLVLIPAEYGLVVEGITQWQDFTATSTYLDVFTDEAGQVNLYITDPGGGTPQILEMPVAASPAERWRWPHQGGKVIMAANMDGVHSLYSNSFFVTECDIHPRWLSYIT